MPSPTYTLFWLMLIAILFASAVGIHVTDPPASVQYQWPDVQDRGPTPALAHTSWLLTATHRALIRHAPNASSPLTYRNLDQTSTAIGLIDYPDVQPYRWRAAPAEGASYHLVWVEKDGGLFSAQISAAGETLRGPITLAENAAPHFITLPYGDDRLLLLWSDNSTGRLMFNSLDPTGLPFLESKPLDSRVGTFAAAVDRRDTLHLAWLQSRTPGAWTVQYQAVPINDAITLDAPSELYTITLEPEATLASIALGLDQTHAYLVWGIRYASAPDDEQVHVLHFPLERPDLSTVQPLRLPPAFDPRNMSAWGPVAPAAVTGTAPAALRWVDVPPGQYPVLPVALAVQTTRGWRPAVVYFQGGDSLGFQRVADLPADAGPIQAAIDEVGALHVAWTGLVDDTTPHLYTSRYNREGLLVMAAEPPGTRRALVNALVWLPAALVWLIVPTCIVLLTPRNHLTLPLAAAVYGGVKLLWPVDLFATYPPLLASLGGHSSAPGIVCGLTLLLIALVGSGAASLVALRKRPAWQVWLVYGLLDAVLTWLVFGANMSG
jgi:hypothetical protein